MHQGRLRMRPWLEEQIHSGKYPGVTWLDETAGVFQIPWKHAARHGWNIDKDATLFRNWAMHTGRYKPGIDKPDPKTWKANFRCALNSLPDVKELRDKSIKKGNNAFRVYMILPSIKTPKRRKGLRKSDSGIKYEESGMISFAETTQSGVCPPLEMFTEVFGKHRRGENEYGPGIFHNKDTCFTTSAIKDGPPEHLLSQLPFPTDTHGNTEHPVVDNEHTQAVLKIVDHLKNSEQPHDNSRSWRPYTMPWATYYSGSLANTAHGIDYSGYPLQPDFHTYNGHQKPFCEDF
ncbi:hypothetical protein MATL_G00188260 [Megalops atlanticus]|uniref:IRF tryptophan pentad repeat domain-containing protein n=1 Tax=Megalops atlanticus TaxID=7932 RepID=A0A9D3PL17_MEGAT|nr:hypothetical protein MATL_G00188260 [Megalops atlanticus]